MITASLVLYHSPDNQVSRVLDCIQNSIIDKVFVIDNSSCLNSEKLCSKYSKAEYQAHDNTGYGDSHNIGMRKAVELKSDYHLVVNPDIYFDKELVETLKTYMDENIDVAQIMPKIINPSGELQYLCKLIPSPFDLIFKRFFPGKIKEKMSYKFQLKFTDYNHIMNVPYLSGCFMFFRTKAFETVGMFDERFFMYPEDIDITRRMHEQYKTIYYPFVSVIHDHAAESYHSKKMLKIHITNMIKYFNKWGWLFDKKRKQINKKVLLELNYKELRRK